METKPFITVITPTYNRAELLWYAIDSVLNQDQEIPFEWEMIICDDGSTDNTKDIVDKYIKDYPHNIFYYYQKNSGIPWCARNLWLNHMNKKSDYTIFLDSDDELKSNTICACLKKLKNLKIKNKKILWLYYLCEDDSHQIVWNKNILWWDKEKYFNYKSYLSWEINVELWTFIKSSIFNKSPKLRFSDKVVTESILWAQMYQYCEEHWLYMFVRDFVWRFYRLNHTSQIRICKNVSEKRFNDNAEGNKILFDSIKTDLEKYWYNKMASDILFRVWINYVLSWNKNTWIMYLKKSLKTKFRFYVYVLYIISKFSRKIILFLYKLFA